MDNTEICGYILSRVETDLSPCGYSRSGKGSLFYRFTADKRVGCAVELQRSLFNSPESYSFTFNLLCVGLRDLDDYSGEKLTVSALKACMKKPYVAERIGPLCRGGDYWWEITEEFVAEYGLKGYYDRFIQGDMKKCAAYLDGLAAGKEKRYMG